MKAPGGHATLDQKFSGSEPAAETNDAIPHSAVTPAKAGAQAIRRGLVVSSLGNRLRGYDGGGWRNSQN